MYRDVLHAMFPDKVNTRAACSSRMLLRTCCAALVVVQYALVMVPYCKAQTADAAGDGNIRIFNAKDQSNIILTLLAGSEAGEGSAPNRHLALGAGDAPAKDAGVAASSIMTMAEAVSRARTRGPDLLADNAAYRAARWTSMASLFQYGPTLSVNAQTGHEYSQSTISSTPIQAPDHHRTDYSFVLRQPLFDLSAIASYFRDDAQADAAEAKRDFTDEQVTFDTVATYYDLVRAQLEVELAREYRDQMARLSTYEARRAAAGVVSGADMERVKAVELSAERMMQDAATGLDSAMVTFERLTGVQPAALDIPVQPVPDIPLSLNDALEDVPTSAEMRAARSQIRAAKYDKQATMARALPKVSLEVGRYKSINPSGQLGQTRDTRAMFVMTWQFNPGQQVASSFAQAARQEEAEQRYRSSAMQAEQRVRTNYLALSGVKRQLDVAQSEYATNVSVAKSFDAQLEAKSRSLLDVLDAYQKLYQSKRVMGGLLISNIEVRYQLLKNISLINQPYGER